jgi:hypothetical protein
MVSQFTDIKVFPRSHAVIKAGGSFLFADAFRINFTLIKNSQDGSLWVGLPSHTYEKANDAGVNETKRVLDVFCTNDAVKTEMTKILLDEYKKATSGTPVKTGTYKKAEVRPTSAPNPEADGDDTPPF